MSTKFGVDSSGLFLLEHRHSDRHTHTQSHRLHLSLYPPMVTTAYRALRVQVFTKVDRCLNRLKDRKVSFVHSLCIQKSQYSFFQVLTIPENVIK